MEYTVEVPLKVGECALLLIDLQKFSAEPGFGYNKDVDPNNMSDKRRYLFDKVHGTVIPAVTKLLNAFRKTKSEIIYTYVESLTKDGRDQSLDYKIHKIFVPKGSPEAAIVEPLAPTGDEIMIPKTSCSVFCSTNIEYVLRNLGVKQLVMVGLLTNECVESAVRDAADKGFLVTVVEDGCAARSPEEHDRGLANMPVFARVSTAAQVEVEVLSFM